MTDLYEKKIVISVLHNRRVTFFFKFVRKMSADECFTRLFNMVHMNRIISFFYTKKDTHFQSHFIIAKHYFVNVRDSAILEE